MAPLRFRETLRIVLRVPNTWLLGGYAFLLFGTMTMMQGLWAVPSLMEANGLARQEAANVLTLWALGLMFGCTLWGYIADRVVKTRKGVICTGAVLYALVWALLAFESEGLPEAVLPLAMFWKMYRRPAGHIPLAGYRTLFWICFASVALSVVLALLSDAHRPAEASR